jgi:hypothetical protein
MAAGPGLEAQVRDLAAQWMTVARQLKSDPDPASPGHTRASALESCAAMIRDLLNIGGGGEDIDHARAAARAAAEGLAPRTPLALVGEWREHAAGLKAGDEQEWAQGDLMESLAADLEAALASQP